MGLIAVDELRELSDPGEDLRVSIYFPTAPGGREIGQKNSTRLKNLLRQALDALQARGVSKPDAEALLAPAQELLPDEHFWRNQGEGFGGFASPGRFRTYRLPLPVEEQVLVARRFYLKPLLPMLFGDGRFYVLAISQNRTRLLEGTSSSVRELDARAIPDSLLEAVGYDFQEGSLQFHSGGPVVGGARSSIFHGQGAGVDDTKVEIEKFLRLVDRALLGLLRDREAPLVVAAAEPVLSMYREVSKHPALVPTGVEGNPDQASPAQLHERAWRLVQPLFSEARRRARQRYDELAGTGRATADLAEILPAVYDGRVETLFVATDAARWGRFEAESRALILASERTAESHDLLDIAAVEALRRSASVYAVPAKQVPGGGSAAAIFRY